MNLRLEMVMLFFIKQLFDRFKILGEKIHLLELFLKCLIYIFEIYYYIKNIFFKCIKGIILIEVSYLKNFKNM